MSLRNQIRKGSTELVLLTLLTQRPMYGYEISQEMSRASDGYFEMKEGLLYPTLHRLQKEGLLSSEWQKTENERRRKYYSITAAGRERLKEQSSEWQTFMHKLQEIINTI
ncbi:MAG: putative DNA-binding protein YwzG [Ardenticatenaceae bacterium]|nr:MAG: putative DNA-binding protein YwzG [Ardenticatenaceae bacterium]